MQPDHIGRLPLSLVPASVTGETVASYAARIDGATLARAGHLWALAISVYRDHEALKPHTQVGNAVAERATDRKSVV